MNNNQLQENLKKWLEVNSNEFKFNDQEIAKIIDLTDNYISEDDKAQDDLWLEYFMYMNFSNDRLKKIKDAWDKNYISEKLKLTELNIFGNILFASILECAKRGVFEKNLTFEENNFYLGINKLEGDISNCIMVALESLQYEKK